MIDHDLRDRLRTAYDAMAEARDRKAFPDWKRRIREDVLALLRRERQARLLEIGAGTGRDGTFFAAHGPDVVCIDLSSEMIRLCREKGLDAEVMDVVDLRFSDGSFDAAYALSSLLHLPKHELPVALREVRRILRPGGTFFLGVYGGTDQKGVWDGDTYDPKRFFSFHTDEGLLETVGRIFDVRSFERVATGEDDPGFHFQSLILTKRTARRP